MARTATSKNGVATTTTAPSRNAIGATSTNGSASPTPTQPRPVTTAETKPAAHTAATVPAGRPATKPTHEQIGRRAYEIYLDRCQRGQPGTPQTDWSRAEVELNRG